MLNLIVTIITTSIVLLLNKNFLKNDMNDFNEVNMKYYQQVGMNTDRKCAICSVSLPHIKLQSSYYLIVSKLVSSRLGITLCKISYGVLYYVLVIF